MISLLCILPIIAATLSGIIGLVFLLLYNEKPAYKIYLFFSFSCFLAMTYSITCAGLYTSQSFTAALTWRRFQAAALSLFTLSILNFILIYINYKNKTTLRIIQITCIVSVLLQFIISSDLSWKISEQVITSREFLGQTVTFYDISQGIIADILIANALISYFFVFIITYKNRKLIPDRKKTYIYISVFIFYLAFINDALLMYGVLSTIYMTSLATAILVCLIAYSMMDTIIVDANLKNELEIANHKLVSLSDKLQTTNSRLEEKLTVVSRLQSDLQEMATRDSLTGLYNRHLLDQKLQSEFEHTKNLHCCSLGLIDMDHFKTVNDRYGHQTGDYLLKTVSAKFLSYFRKSDLLFRYGGDEFLILLPNTCDTDAQARLNELRKQIASQTFNYDGQSINMTISIGISQMFADDQSPESVLKRADRALYKAKIKGRNIVDTSHD